MTSTVTINVIEEAKAELANRGKTLSGLTRFTKICPAVSRKEGWN